MKRKILALAGTIVLVLGAVCAQAASTTYYFTVTNDPSLTNGPWGTVNLNDATGNVTFTVDVDETKFVVPTPNNFGLQSFFFNYSGVTLDETANFLLPTGWSVRLEGAPYNSGGGFGWFEADVRATGQYRADPLVFSIVGVAGDSIWNYVGTNAEGYAYAAHIAGYNSDGEGSGKFAATPIPPSVLLLGSGVAGLVLKRARGLKRGRS